MMISIVFVPIFVQSYKREKGLEILKLEPELTDLKQVNEQMNIRLDPANVFTKLGKVDKIDSGLCQVENSCIQLNERVTDQSEQIMALKEQNKAQREENIAQREQLRTQDEQLRTQDELLRTQDEQLRALRDRLANQSALFAS